MQDEMRLSQPNEFPKITFFKKLKQEMPTVLDNNKPHLPNHNHLDTIENVGFFTWFLLNKVEDSEFQET